MLIIYRRPFQTTRSITLKVKLKTIPISHGRAYRSYCRSAIITSTVKKEVSDRLHSMRYEDFHVKGESPATTLERITGYIDKMAVLALPVNRTDDAKARFASNVTQGQIWAYHAKGIISATASYDRVIQAFATSIRYRAELESGRQARGTSNRRRSYQRAELYQTGKSQQSGTNTEYNSNDEVFLTHLQSEPLTAETLNSALETYFGSAWFARNPRDVKSHPVTSVYNNSRFQKDKGNTTSSASSVGCFNCVRRECSVASCTKPRDTERIARNISKWRELRKMQKSARININTVPSICTDHSEANEVMIAAISVNQYSDDDNVKSDGNDTEDPFADLNETFRSNVVDHMSLANE